MKAKSIILIFFLFFIYSCHKGDDLKSVIHKTNIIAHYFYFHSKWFIKDKIKILLLLRTQNQSYIADANYLIRKNKDTVFVPLLLTDANNTCISNGYVSKGMTIYESKMKALSKISGIKPPKPITDEPDSVIIKFYRDWAIKKGYKLN